MSGAIRQVVFDAGGTLFEVREPVGETYARAARSQGFPVAAAAMEAGFRSATAAAPPLAAPSTCSTADRLAFERAWWRGVVERAFGEALDDPDFAGRTRAAFERCFEELFAHYADPRAWRLFADAPPVLAELCGRGLRLAVLSNFDGRLHGLIDGLGLGSFFSLVIASSEAGAAKPDRAAFAVVARLLRADDPAGYLHVGDSFRDDVCGAVAAGFSAVWLVRSDASGQTAASTGETPPGPAHDALGHVPRLGSLAELPALVGSIA